MLFVGWFLSFLSFMPAAGAGTIVSARPTDPTCEHLLLKMGQDEGMWLLNRAPVERLAETYGFKPDQAWLQHVMRASIKFGAGGSGSLVSSNGLVMTNHHVARDTLQKLSTPKRDLLETGFVARSRADELKAPDLEVKQLREIVDVTNRVLEGLTDEMSDAQAQVRKRANIAKIEEEAKRATGLLCEVVELYLGAEYHLYKYKSYKDVRVVFAPEHAAAAFGGDELNFEYPRYSLDVAFLRIYDDNGTPLETKDFFKWSIAGPKKDELVFVTGHPGATNRLYTVDHMQYVRDLQLPFTLALLNRRIGLLENFSKHSDENRRLAKSALLRLENSLKVLSGDARGLNSPELLDEKKTEEELLKRHLARTAHLQYLNDSWATVSRALKVSREEFLPRAMFVAGEGFSSKLFTIARHIVRMAFEDQKPNELRLPEYRDGRRASLNLEVLSKAPTSKEYEIVTLADSLALLQESLGRGNKIVGLVLEGKGPSARAAQLVNDSRLDQVETRQALIQGGLTAVLRSKDPMIQLALQIEPESRRLRTRFEQEVETATQRGYKGIARARYSLFGNNEYPDATGTLRMAFGRVKGYSEDSSQLAPWTDVQSVFALQRSDDDSYSLPASWQEDIDWGDLAIPYNFVSTADTIGGNSGSPVINQRLEIVGINFDSNRHKIEKQRYSYTEGRSRHISVHSFGITQILKRVYGAPYLLDEIGR